MQEEVVLNEVAQNLMEEDAKCDRENSLNRVISKRGEETQKKLGKMPGPGNESLEDFS